MYWSSECDLTGYNKKRVGGACYVSLTAMNGGCSAGDDSGWVGPVGAMTSMLAAAPKRLAGDDFVVSKDSSWKFPY